MQNFVSIAGRLAKPLELKKTQSGLSVLSFELPVQRDFKSADGEKETDWIPVTVWRNDADYLAKYANKGDNIIVNGRLQSRKFTDRNGNNRVAWEIQAEKVYLLSGGKRDGNGNSTASAYQELGESASGGGFAEIEEDGTLPF